MNLRGSMDFRVELSEQAQRDIAGIYDWLESRQAGDAGEHWFVDLRTASASLVNFPSRCHLAPENADSPVALGNSSMVESRISTASCSPSKTPLCTER